MSDPAELHPEHNILIRKLRSISPLGDDEKQCLATLQFSTRAVAPDQDIVREGDRPSECCLVLEGFVCRYKLTDQAELGDALGLSTVHVNRSLQELRGKRLITLRGSILTVADWEGLKAVGEFDPTYLHLDGHTERAA